MGFTETILRIEAERMEQARQAIEAGWTPEDHPAKCCPHLLETKPAQPKQRAGVEWYETRLRNAEAKAERLQSIIERTESAWAAERRPDYGEVNIPWGRKRDRELTSRIRRGREVTEARRELAHTLSRVNYWKSKVKEVAA